MALSNLPRQIHAVPNRTEDPALRQKPVEQWLLLIIAILSKVLTHGAIGKKERK